MSELLPCPFCGGKAETYSYEAERGICIWVCWCKACEAMISEKRTEAEAIEAWNTRVEAYAIAIDAVREVLEDGLFVGRAPEEEREHREVIEKAIENGFLPASLKRGMDDD